MTLKVGAFGEEGRHHQEDSPAKLGRPLRHACQSGSLSPPTGLRYERGHVLHSQKKIPGVWHLEQSSTSGMR